MRSCEDDLGNSDNYVTAVLGPTNTGKTHLAIERMLGHRSGIIGLPLRLLAREVYDKICHKIGIEKVALITGEEKIKPQQACYWIATVEAMPLDLDVDFLAIDEVQLANDPERGHVFTDRILHARGRRETLFLGSQTIAGLLSDIVPKLHFITRPRHSKLSYASQKKITRLPQRSAVIAFSANEVYSLAELVRRQRGGAAVVLGALSPRTRNAQVALFQSGDVDYLVATDAIGMGLNLDLDYVAFSSIRKFDGQNFRSLTPAEIGQIAGRAGRHMNDGYFGVTGACEQFKPELIEAIETHTFDPIHVLQWRSRKLDFRSLTSLRKSLLCVPSNRRLIRARSSEDLIALEHVTEDPEVQALAVTEDAVKCLWEVCQLPDYRKISSQNHAELIATLYKDLMKPSGRIDEDWFSLQVKISNRTDGDIDTLANRLAHIRTWTFVSNRKDWLKDPAYWQQKTRDIENILSDALHECLTQRFVDRKTSVLLRGLRDKTIFNAEISDNGSVLVENHFVGRLRGFNFIPDGKTNSLNAKAMKGAVSQVLEREYSHRSESLINDKSNFFEIDPKGQIRWRGQEIAVLGETSNPLRPSINLLADNHLNEFNRKKILQRLDVWLDENITTRLEPLIALSKAEDVTGLARGTVFSLIENFGALKRLDYSRELKGLDQSARSQLRKYGVRFGAYNIYFPSLLKPASTQLLFVLWSIKYKKKNVSLTTPLLIPPRPGLTSLTADLSLPEDFYRVCGYHLCGSRAIRFDILERLSNIIRPLLAWKPKEEVSSVAPDGASGDGGFYTTSEMISLLGCSTMELETILEFMGFKNDINTKRKELLVEKNIELADDKFYGICRHNSAACEEMADGEGKDILFKETLKGKEPGKIKEISIWRPVTRSWQKKSHKNKFYSSIENKFQDRKQTSDLEKEEKTSAPSRTGPVVPKDQKSRITSDKPERNFDEGYIQKYATANKDMKKIKGRKGIPSEANHFYHSVSHPELSRLNSPFADLLKIKAKLERAQRK